MGTIWYLALWGLVLWVCLFILAVAVVTGIRAFIWIGQWLFRSRDKSDIHDGK